MWFGNRIYREIMRTIKAEVAKAQKEYDEKLKALQEKYLAEREALKVAHKETVETEAKQIVHKFIGKFLD